MSRAVRRGPLFVAVALLAALALAGSAHARPPAARGTARLAPRSVALLESGSRAHPDSQSRTVLTWVEGAPQLEVKVQVTSLAEVLPNLALDESGLLTPAALEEGADSIRSYLRKHLSVVVDGAALELDRGEVRFEAPNGARSDDGWQWVVLRTQGPRGPAASAAVEMDLFLETSPGHLDTLVVRWPDALPEVEVLSAGSAAWEGQAGPSLRLTQLLEGAHAAATGVAWLCLLSLLCVRVARGGSSDAETAASGAGLRSPLVVLVWAVGAGIAFWAPLDGLGLEPRTLGLASAIAAVYLGSDGWLNGARARGALETLAAGGAMGLGLASHPEVLPAPLDPGGAVALFCAGGVLGGLLLALAAAGLLRPVLR
ncbi:MAG: hypothetical protein O2799_02545, partial [Planctomycetota bacterium]|nr:hypothetical protein [Planctomycetota bacterium]